MRRMNDLSTEGGNVKRLTQRCEVDTHMHSSGLRQWPWSASQPRRHRAVTKRKLSLAHHKDKARTCKRKTLNVYMARMDRWIWMKIGGRTQVLAEIVQLRCQRTRRCNKERGSLASRPGRGRASRVHRPFILRYTTRSEILYQLYIQI